MISRFLEIAYLINRPPQPRGCFFRADSPAARSEPLSARRIPCRTPWPPHGWLTPYRQSVPFFLSAGTPCSSVNPRANKGLTAPQLPNPVLAPSASHHHPDRLFGTEFPSLVLLDTLNKPVRFACDVSFWLHWSSFKGSDEPSTST